MAPATTLPSVVNREGDVAGADSSSRTNGELTLTNTPRNVVIRSRVLMQRTAAGPRGIALPKELWPVSGKVQSGGDGEAGGFGRWNRATHFVGDGPQLVPVELVAAASPRKGRTGSAPGVKGERGSEDLVGADRSQHFGAKTSKVNESRWALFSAPALTPDLRAELKQRLDSMSRADCKVNPKSATFFLREFSKVCQLLKLPVHPRPYRKGVGDALQHFVQLLPEQLQVDMAQLKTELRDGSYLALTVMIALGNISWDFNFNSTTHRVCNCGSNGCFFPMTGVRPSDYQTFNWRGSGNYKPVSLSKATPRGSVLKGSGTETTGPGPVPGATQKGYKEKHFPQKLIDSMEALKARFLEFSTQVGTFLEDLLTIPDQAGELNSHGQQAWERWVSHVVSEISVLDRYYTGFEQIYMGLVQKLIETTLEPVLIMSNPSDMILRGEGPFQEMAASVLCQQLGLLKKQVDFNGHHQLVSFDPALLEKARRVLQMETYVEVQDMARNLLRTFDRLCQVLSQLEMDQIKPQLSENAELKQAVLTLEEAWAECQYLLHQGSLDFMKEMIEQMPRLSARLKWQMKIALGAVTGKAEDDQEERHAARVALYQTVPMVIYVDELWKDIGPQATGVVTGNSAQSSRSQSQAFSAQDRQKPRFQELFCPQDDRHHTLRRDFGKFDEQRYQRFRSFLTGEENRLEGDDDGQRDFFLLVYKQLKAVAGFPVQESVTDAITAASASSQAESTQAQPLSSRDAAELQRTQELLEGAARWVCLVTQVQAVAPHLFPSQNPVIKRESLQGMQRRGSMLPSARRASISKEPQLTTVVFD